MEHKTDEKHSSEERAPAEAVAGGGGAQTALSADDEDAVRERPQVRCDRQNAVPPRGNAAGYRHRELGRGKREVAASVAVVQDQRGAVGDDRVGLHHGEQGGQQLVEQPGARLDKLEAQGGAVHRQLCQDKAAVPGPALPRGVPEGAGHARRERRRRGVRDQGVDQHEDPAGAPGRRRRHPLPLVRRVHGDSLHQVAGRVQVVLLERGHAQRRHREHVEALRARGGGGAGCA